MNRIAQAFHALSKRGERAVIPYLTAGYPDWDTFLKVLEFLGEEGASMVEVGIPFSDPVADGPVIQRASERALAMGVTPKGILERLKKRCRSKSGDEGAPTLPTIAMGYYNPILRYGVDRFAKEASEAGISGIIVPDLPPEEAKELRAAAERAGIATIFLVAPTTPKERIATIAEATTGFLYLVSIKGVTGTRLQGTGPIIERIETIRSVTDLPLCVGFGISDASQARELSRHADGVIVGSALIRAIDKDGEEGARKLIREIAKAVNGQG